ncbi:MAG: alanine/glycine:cation symporter family protein [Gammaproteobacteria bacterium]|jgi:AGCS family alanine or glycine:cation symporter
MSAFLNHLDAFMSAINGVIWANWVLYVLVGVGVLFTLWSVFCQYRALTHGTAVIRGLYDDAADPGAINHFQALSAALSATVGLGNIGGVALAIALGGPGSVFWMWVVGFFGMAIKLTEVTLSMIYRNTHDPDNPHGGPMWVASKGFAHWNPRLKWVGQVVGVVFCITLLVSTVTGGNMFQAWNVGVITEQYTNIPGWVTGLVLAVLVGMVIIGGIKRIGAVAGRLVPFMVILYLASGIYVLIVNWAQIPAMFGLIIHSAFNPQEATGAFLGGTAGFAFLMGMKRALFSNEAGQGSSPIAHSAAKTDEPVREGVVAGLEPFIDTILVCTLTALVILSSGIWNRGPEAHYAVAPPVQAVPATPNTWTLPDTPAPPRANGGWTAGDNVFMRLSGSFNPDTGNRLHRLDGDVEQVDGRWMIHWNWTRSETRPSVDDTGIFVTYPGAALTAKAFDDAMPGLGKWLVSIAAWLFAISTMISWSYYGEQGIVYLFGEKAVLPYKYIYCVLVFVATLPIIQTPDQLDNLTGIGTGVMLWANVPIILIFGHQAMAAYRNYIGRLKSGQMERSPNPPTLRDLISGKDVL